MMLELFENAVLILTLCLVYWFVVQRWPQGRWIPQVAVGLLFGLAAVIAMRMTVNFAPGIIFDSRTVVLSLGALFAGPVVALIAGITAAVYRVWLGGDGLAVGLLTIVLATLVGLVFRQYWRDRVAHLSAGQLLMVALAVHVPAIALFALLPLDFFSQILGRLAPPYLTLLPLATVAAGLGFREIERFHQFANILGEGERSFRSLFNSAEIALLEVDLSQTWRHLQKLRARHVTDPRDYVLEHPDYLQSLIDSVRILRVNHAGLHLLMIGSEEDLNGNLNRFLGPGSSQVFVDLIASIWSGSSRFRASAIINAADGKSFTCFVSLPLPDSEAHSRRVPVSLLDVTELQQAQSEVLEQRRRLEEILWGTNVGTWEWFVQTGKTRFNARWAEICGYRLQELEPISIETWNQLLHPDDLAISNRALEQAFAREVDFYECVVRMRHKDGHYVWVHDRGKVIEWGDDGKPLRMSGTHTDVTEQKRAEMAAERLSSMRKTLLNCHKIILLEQREEILLQRLTDCLLASRGYVLAWIGRPIADPEKRVVPVAQAGTAKDYLNHIEAHWSDDRLSGGPVGMAVKTGKVRVTRDIQADTDFAPWSVTARRYGLRSAAASPILVNGTVELVLSIYSDEVDGFPPDELDLLSEFSSNLSLALQSMRSAEEQSRLSQQLRHTTFGTIGAIAATIEKRDPYTSGHQHNVAEIAVAIAGKLEWDRGRIMGLQLGATIHDIGKIYIPAEILNRPGRLSEHEFGMIKSHPQVGYDILDGTDFPWPIAQMILQHHERMDGSGYPNQLSGDQIIAEARIMAVADVLDAMTCHRPYRPGLGMDKALEEIEGGRGSIYDPQVVDACLSLVREDGYRWGLPAGQGLTVALPPETR